IERLCEQSIGKPRREGVSAATWVLLDYGDVVVHIFAPEEREYYNLESFWSGAKVIEIMEQSHLRDETGA
ncbi:MAG TPA: RsfS/YbeB/iojap family protein, partial [Armatimonadota bacterium]|nr:RsfS/YbeB/iojap family protein [Armatimonadota bacterium]